jgi:hypothetical protein
MRLFVLGDFWARGMDSKTRPGRCDKRGAPAQGVRVWELVRRVLFGGVERSPGAPGSKAALRTPGNALQGAAAVPGEPVGGGCKAGWGVGVNGRKCR